jgi:branched-chain amino acid aminotransferase
MIVWLNGALLAAAEARIDPTDRGFLLGDGVFETICVAEGEPRHLPRHLHRLRDGAAVLGIPLDLSDAEIDRIIASVVAANRLEQAAVRITLTRGPAPRGVLPPQNPCPTLLVAAQPLTAAAGAVDLIVAKTVRRNELSVLSRIKSLNYLDNILARQEAASRGAGDALLLNSKDRVAETTVANLFALCHGRLLTPPVADGALPGVVRALLLERCGAAEASLSVEMVATADAVLLTNSLSVRAAASLDGHFLARDRRLERDAHAAALAP